MSREAFFARIRAEVVRAGAVRPRDTEPDAPPGGHRLDIVRREMAERWPGALERFARELEAVGGVLHRVKAVTEVPGVVGRLARERGLRRLVSWHPRALGVDWEGGLAAEGLEVERMPLAPPDQAPVRDALRARVAAADVGLTGVDAAVAETGSLVLLSGHGRPRSTSLLPPVHVAVFDAGVLVESLAQLGAYLDWWQGPEGPPWRGGAVNVITGPSRTADIELTLTRGVHGPRELHAIFVEEGLLAGDAGRG